MQLAIDPVLAPDETLAPYAYSPEQVDDADRAKLCQFFGVPEAQLGGVDPRWAKLHVAKEVAG